MIRNTSPGFQQVLCFALVTACISLHSQAQSRVLLAVSKVDHNLVIVDPATLKVTGRVPVGPDPHEIAVSADGGTAYVSNPGYGSFHEINVINLGTRQALPNIDTKPLLGPHGLSFINQKLYFTAQGSKAVGRYDVQTAALDWSMGTGQNTTHMIYVSPDEHRIITTNVESGTISIFDNVLLQPAMPPTGVMPAAAKPRMDWLQTLIAVGKGDEGFDVSPNAQELWTVKPDGGIAIIDLKGKKLADNVESGVLGLHRLLFTPDGTKVLIVSVRTGDLLVYDAKTRREIKRFYIGHGASMLMDAEGQRAFISCTPDNYIAVFDLRTLKVTNHLDIGGRPDGLAFSLKH